MTGVTESRAPRELRPALPPGRRALPAQLAWAGMRGLLRHPVRTLKLSAAFELADAKMLARNLGALRRDATLQLMIAEGVQDVTFEREGERWRSDLGDGIGAALWNGRGHDEETITDLSSWLKRHGRIGPVIVDAGANVGTTTIPFAQIGYTLIAIEPVPRTAMMLRENIAAHGLDARVTVAELAIDSSHPSVEIWTGFGSGQAEVAKAGVEPSITRFGGSKGDLLTVPAAGLMEILRNANVEAGQVAVVWSDVQGSEREVIESGFELWAAGVPLYLEVDPFSLDAHAGVEGFVTVVEERFEAFLPRTEIGSDGTPSPISAFRSWVAALPKLRYDDALLLPRKTTREPR